MSGGGLRCAVDAALEALNGDLLAVHTLVEALDQLAPDEVTPFDTARTAAHQLLWVLRRMLDRVMASHEDAVQLLNRRVLPLVDAHERRGGFVQPAQDS